MILQPVGLGSPPKNDQRDTAGRHRTHLFLMTSQLNVGGTERQFVLLANALQDRFRIHLGCLGRSGAFLSEIVEIEEFPLGGSFLTGQAWRSRRALWRRLRTSSVAVAHSFDFYGNLMLIPVARAAGVPIVMGSFRSLGDRLTPLQIGVLVGAFHLCDRVVCNSRAAAAKLAEHGLPAKKLAVIPNALSPAAFGHAAPALAAIDGLVRVGMIGRMNEKVKNQEMFLRACGLLAKRFPRAEFALAGDGPLRGQYEQMARALGIAQRVRFLGERRDVQAVLASLDVAVVPSLSESLSNVVLESMAAGKAVVASRVGGNKELVQDGVTGCLVHAEDYEECANAVGSLLSDINLRNAMGRRAQEFTRENFGLERVCERYEREYNELLERKRTKGLRRGHSAEPSREQGQLKVALVAPSTRTLGGQAVQADLLIRSWQADADVQASFVLVDPAFPSGLGWIERIPFLRTVVRMPLYLAALWQAVGKADIVHLFSASYWSFLLAPAPALFMARWRGKATVLNYRSGEARDHLQNWRTAVPVLRRADRLVVPSGYLRDVFAEFGLEAEVVPNVVDLSQFSYRPRQPLLPHLVCTRGFEPYYDVDQVVRAFGSVKKEFPDGRLCLVGGGRLEPQVRQVVRELSLGGSVEFTGSVPRDRIGEAYARNHIFLNASWLDNMPVSLLEAFASGTPVVTTAPEGIRYIVEHERTGLLCDPKDWRGLAENVLRLLRDPEFALRLAGNAYEESRRYRWDTVREQWLEVYRSVSGQVGRFSKESLETESQLEGVRQ
jgi:glycosyltransferase involved in cell wall biosynthesis